MPYYKRFSPELENQIINAHKQKESVTLIAKRFGITTVSVYNILRRNGITTRNGSVVFPNKRLDYFDKIDTLDKAYFLGLFAADGCIRRKTKDVRALVISLNAGDADILRYHSKLILGEDAVTFGRASNPKQDGTYSQNAWLVICGKQISDKVCEFGIGEQKSFSCDSDIESLNDELFKAYVLGLFDGDGSIMFKERKGRKFPITVMTLLGSTILMPRIGERIHKLTGIKMGQSLVECKGGNLLYLRTSSRSECVRLLEWLYSTNINSLSRKKDVYLKIKAYDEGYRELRKMKSKYPYITLDNRNPRPRWKAQAVINRQKYYLGQYDTEEEAYAVQQKFYKQTS